MALVGYARVSSVGQSLDVQLDKLKHCDKIFKEKKSGASDQRRRLKACLEYVRDSDTLVVTRLDRLARSTLHLCRIAEELQRKQVNLHVLDQNIDTSDATGRLLFNMLGAIGQFETEIRAERQMDGIKKAKERGIRFGRTKKLNQQQINELQKRRKNGALIKDLMTDYSLSKASVYRYLRQAHEKHRKSDLKEYFSRDLDREHIEDLKRSAQRRIRMELSRGHSYSTIAKKLNDEAYPTIDGKSMWTWQAVKKYNYAQK
jgi:DNA invertase Pin-like site-specific DNA recombinase